MIEHIENKEMKMEITKTILADLPEWFGIESSVDAYVKASANQDFIAYNVNGAYVGFVTLEDTSAIASDVHVLGVLKKHHGQSIGQKLMLAIEDLARKKGKKFITVKTLSHLHSDAYYRMTRHFYEKIGYEHLETFTTLWGEDNPCDYYIKDLVTAKTNDETAKVIFEGLNGKMILLEDCIEVRKLKKNIHIKSRFEDVVQESKVERANVKSIHVKKASSIINGYIQIETFDGSIEIAKNIIQANLNPGAIVFNSVQLNEEAELFKMRFDQLNGNDKT